MDDIMFRFEYNKPFLRNLNNFGNYIMISDYYKKYNGVSKLYKSKWTSLKKINGWKHYEVANIDKKNKKLNYSPYVTKETE